MDTQLLEAIRIIMREELKPVVTRYDKKFDELENKMDIMLEGWSIQGLHRKVLDDHEERITTVEHHISAIL